MIQKFFQRIFDASFYKYTKSLVNTNSFYTNFTNKHFQKVPIPQLNTYYKKEIPSLTRISLHVVLTNLVNTNFALHDFFPEPKVAKELVYSYTVRPTVLD